MANNQTFTLNIKALFDASDVKNGAKQIQDAFKNIKVSNNLQSDFNKAFSNLENAVAKVQQKYEQGFKTKADVTSYEKAFKEMETAATQYEKVIQRIQNEVGTSLDLSKVIKWDGSILQKIRSVDQEIQRLKQSLQFNTNSSTLTKVEEALKGIKSNAPATTEAVNKFKEAISSGNLENAQEALEKLQNIWKRFGEDNINYKAIFGEEGLAKAFEELKNSDIFKQISDKLAEKGQIQAEEWQKLFDTIGNGGKSLEDFNNKAGQAKSQLLGAASAQQAWNNQVDQFKSRIQYFFGLNNVIQLIRRSVREAYETVKELDAAMAQTAVVTDFNIQDMWNQLPKYTELANQLGVTTKGAYETMTLFYQQGLDTNQAFALGTETMKMARIAGLDYATATDYMTAALRGFNMELNELSAQKVNDVYSRLAAITASNTQEISTAMTKVASLAHNANMEFETTSAFLAQIIETTRESAETAGTALKTVVARFSEVKKLINENQITGTDEEGQIIDVNKVAAALRTAGIDMNKYFIGEVGLDDIFMELASKWDSLTTIQQRYIATQAAGSRQQSRFIAMMSNYSRTQELVTEAYNSAGASEKQFEKTQASLETAVNRLTNAWHQFTMNLANDTAIKSVLTVFTQLLEVINKITGLFGGGWRSVLTGGVTLGTLLGGGKLVNAAFSASKLVKANDMTWGAAFKNQLGRNPYLYDLASGEVKGQAQRGGFLRSYFNPLTEEDQAQLDYYNAFNHAYGTNLKPSGKNFQLKNQRTAGAGIAAAGLAMSAAGSVITQNSEAIADKLNKSSKSVENFGSKMSTLGNTASLAGTMFMMLPPGINAVAAALTALIGVAVAFRGETFSEKLKRLGEETKEAEQAAKSAQEAYDDLLSGAATHDELLNKISKLKEGTLEFRKAILEANQAAQELIDNYGISSEDYFRDNNGLIHFNPGTIEKLQEEQMRMAEEASQRASVARLNEESVRTAGSKYDTFAKAASGIDLYETTDWKESIQAAQKILQEAIPTEEDLIKGQIAYQNTLYDLMGSNLNDATKLAIEGLTSQYNPDEIASKNDEITRIVNALNDTDVRAAFEKEIGQIPKDLDIDGIRQQLILQRQAVALQTKVTQEASKVQSKASKDALNYSKKTIQQVLALGSSKNTYDLLAAQSAQNKLATAQRQVSEYTDLPFNLRFGSFTVEQTEQIGNIAKNFGTNFGSKTATAVITEINNTLLKGDNSLFDALSSINFGTALSSNLKQLRDAIGDTGKDATNIFNTAFEEIGGEAGIFQSLYYGQTELIDGFKGMADAAGNIPASAILDAVDSCDELADALEICDLNAGGLAAALTEIDLGNLDAEQMTSGLLKALSAAEDVSSILASADKFLSDWEEAPSGDRFAKWGSGGAKAIMDAWGAGRYQDERARQYMQAMLGNDFMQKYNKVMSAAGDIAYNQGPDAALSHINENLGREIQLFNELSSSDNLQPLYQYFEDTGKILANGAITFKDGMVHFDDEVIKTASDARQALIDSGISEDLTEIMLGDYLQNSPDALIKWNQNAAIKGLDAFREELESGGTVLQGELDNYFDRYKQYFENDEDWLNWKNTFESEIQKYDGQVIKLKVDWATGKDPIGSLKEAFGGDSGLKDYLAENNVFNRRDTRRNGFVEDLDLDNLTASFTKLGATEVQALDLAQQYADQMSETTGIQTEFQASYDKWTQDNNGNWVKTTEQVHGYTSAVEAARAAQEAAAESLSDMESKIRQADISQGIQDAFGTLAADGIEINTIFKKDSTEVDEYQPDDKSATVIFGVDHSAVDSYTPSPKYSTVYYKAEGGASGGIVDSYASGSATNHLSPGPALTGEEGPEIVWNKDKGYAYITGEHHPEFQNLQPGDRVFNAQETKKILNGAANGGKVQSLATGYLPGIGGDSGSKKSGGGSGSGSGKGEKDKTPEEWKNDLDWLYNLMEDIVELERDQKAIEEQYEDALQDQSKTGRDLYNLLIKQLGNLYTQLDHQTFALQKREQEMREFMDTTNDKDQYLWYNWQDRTLEIDWDAIDRITDEEEYKHVKELVDEAEEIQDKMDDADDAIMDITNQIQELENIWRDTFTDFEKRVLDAVIKMYQTVIDNYSELNDTLNNSNQSILDSLQKEINLQRQIRDNTKTEEEISDDEARLAYLRRDTSGGNELAALQLQKELADKRESYEDSLVDQAISRLQDDNAAAQEQRERQIEIMQAQLDYQSENGEFNAYISELLTGAMGADGELLTNSDLVDLLKEQENWAAMSDVSKEVWDEELNGTFKEVAAFLLKQNAEENGTFYTALTAAVESVSSAIGSYSQAMVKIGNQISNAASGGYGGGSSGGSGNSGSSGSGGNINTNGIVQGVVAGITGAIGGSGHSGGCFAKGTSILMDNNIIKAIEDIEIGEIVMAYDENTQIFVPKKVTKAYIHHNTPSLVKLTFDNGKILNLTPGHPLYSTNGWKSLDIENSLYEHGTIATSLKLNDTIIGINGNAKVIGIEFIDIGLNYDTYNIEVEDCHTFLANGFVAHNAKIMGAWATGGIVNHTGLGWLDGTPKEPEYVLNARQTDAFLKLADVLPSMMGPGGNTTTTSFGSNYFNVSVNVDQISSDYDVDRMVDRIKNKLYDDASYRNVNTLSFLR